MYNYGPARSSALAWRADVEFGGKGVMRPRGNSGRQLITKHSLEPGARIVVEGYPAKDGSNRANGRDRHEYYSIGVQKEN